MILWVDLNANIGKSFVALTSWPIQLFISGPTLRVGGSRSCKIFFVQILYHLKRTWLVPYYHIGECTMKIILCVLNTNWLMLVLD